MTEKDWVPSPDKDLYPECGAYVPILERDNGISQGVLPDGWQDIIRVNDMARRCGAIPLGQDGSWGSCGAKPGHEHPHVWIGHHYEILEVARVEGTCDECGHGLNAHGMKPEWRRCMIWKCECSRV